MKRIHNNDYDDYDEYNLSAMFCRESPRNKWSSSKKIDLTVSPLLVTLSSTKRKKKIIHKNKGKTEFFAT